MRIPHAIILALTLLTSGCGDPAEQADVDASSTTAAAPPIESTWDDQLAAIRDGVTTRIAIAQQTISREQWQQLAEGFESLERLEIDDADITDADLELLSGFPQLSQLKLGCEVGDVGMTHIAGAQSLEFLNLPEGRFHDESLALLSQLPRLKQLRFHSPNVTDAGMQSIAGLPSLRYLHLIACPITADGLAHLHGMSELQSFYLDGSDIDDAAIYELIEALPTLHFHRDQLHLPNDPHGHDHSSP